MFLAIFLLAYKSFRVVVPVAALLGSAPSYFISWLVLRSITVVALPRHFYRRYDDFLYSAYQRFILFFFQNWFPVKVGLSCPALT